jgi:serine/threonine protein kinase
MSTATAAAAALAAVSCTDHENNAAFGVTAIASNSNNPNSTIVVDAALLRRALRLVYCLQKERGASCCYYASGKSSHGNSNTSNNDASHYSDDDPLLSSARRDTDCAWNMMVACSTTSLSSLSDHNHHHHHRHGRHRHRRSDSFQSLYAIQAPLAKIRKMVETGNNSNTDSSSRPATERAGFHKIFACFNTLISSVVHEYLLLQTAHQRKYLNRRIKGSASAETKPHPNIRSHSSSHDLFSQHQQQAPVSILRANGSSSSSNIAEPYLSHSEHRPQQHQHHSHQQQHQQHYRNLPEDGVSYLSAMVGSLMLGVDDSDTVVAPPPPPSAPPPPFHNNGDSDTDIDDDGDGVAIVLSDEDKKEQLSRHPFEHFKQQQQQSQHLNETDCAANAVVTTTRVSSPPPSRTNRRAQSYSPSARNTTTRKTCPAAGAAVVAPMRRIESGDLDFIPLDDEHDEQEPFNSNDSLLGGAAEKSKNVTISQQQEEESPEQKVVHLLDLLDIFIKLKESTGIERATLTSLLAAANAAAASANGNRQCHQQHDDNDTQFLLADLVLQVENQRSLLQRLRQLRDSQGGSGSLKNLVHDLVSLSPRLAQLQHDLLHGGGDAIAGNGHHGTTTTTSAIMETVLGANLMENNSNQLWDLLTVYIDKLHSLELLIVEEIECSAAYWMTPLSNAESAATAEASSSSSSPVLSQPHAMLMMNASARKPHKPPPHSMATAVASDTNVPPPPPPPAFVTTSSISNQDDVRVLLKTSFGEFASNQDLLDHVQSLNPDEIKRLLVTRLQHQVRVDFDNQNNGTSQQPDGGAYSESSSTASRSQSSKLLPLANDNHNHNSDGVSGNEVKEGSESEESPANRIDDLLKELCHAPSSKEWEIDLYQIRFLKRIGQGSAGTTYLGDWGGTNVAVKVASITEMGLDGWRKEVQALQMLHHPNIIRLLGSVYHPSPLTFCLVLEYCNAGDLSAAILKPTPPEFWSQVAIGIAKGITYLHHRGIIHVRVNLSLFDCCRQQPTPISHFFILVPTHVGRQRDIKPCNILLDGVIASGKFSVKVTDFGVATDYSTKPQEDRTAETGTYRWMAPEVIRHEIYTQTADVYSFAILLWQLITRERPYANKSAFDAAAGVSMESARPPFPDETPTAFAQLIEQCWNDDPQARPQFDAIVTRLKELVSVLTEPDKAFLDAPMGHAVYKKKPQRQKIDAAAAASSAAVSPAGNNRASMSAAAKQQHSLKLSSARFVEDSSPAAGEKEGNKRRSLFGLGGKGKGRGIFNRASNHF